MTRGSMYFFLSWGSANIWNFLGKLSTQQMQHLGSTEAEYLRSCYDLEV